MSPPAAGSAAPAPSDALTVKSPEEKPLSTSASRREKKRDKESKRLGRVASTKLRAAAAAAASGSSEGASAPAPLGPSKSIRNAGVPPISTSFLNSLPPGPPTGGPPVRVKRRGSVARLSRTVTGIVAGDRVHVLWLEQLTGYQGLVARLRDHMVVRPAWAGDFPTDTGSHVAFHAMCGTSPRRSTSKSWPSRRRST